jgi:hypothetical protein
MLLNRLLKVLLIGLLMFMTFTVVFVAAQDVSPETQAQIDSAMSAAPVAIAKDATIMGVSAEGEAIELRAGTNGWTCYPDWEASPGNDPICLDPTFLAWNDALAAGTEPNVTTPGLAYMLQGGSDPSNTDPTLSAPPEGEDWVNTPPHVMIVLPEKLDMQIYTTDHQYGGPYVMWAGTPFEHIMMPVAALEEMEASHTS